VRIWLGALLVVDACLFPSLGGLSGGDASVDAISSSDASPPQDAGCGDGSPLFCDKLCVVPTFCDDFDHDQAFGLWNGNKISAGGTVAYDTTTVVSSPRAVKCSTPASGSTSQIYASLNKDLAAASRFTVDFDVLVEQPSQSGQRLSIAEIELLPAGWNYATGFVVIDNGYYKYNSTIYALDGSYNGSGDTTSQATVPFGTWTHITFDLDLTNKTMTLSAGGSLAIKTALPSAFIPGSAGSMKIGQFYANGPAPAWTVHLDNVVINTTP